MTAVRPPEPDLARSTATMTVLTLLSRITGFVRNVVVVAVLGVTFLGNTYETANTVPNLLFELIAAGVLQAVLIPTLVKLAAAGEDDEAEHVARSVLGLAAAALAVLAGIGFLVAPWVMRLLMASVDDPRVRADEVRLGTILLWFFLPQVVLYASNTVATGVLNAKGKFGVPVFAGLEPLIPDSGAVDGLVVALANVEPRLCAAIGTAVTRTGGLPAETALRLKDACVRYGLDRDDWFRVLKAELHRRGVLRTETIIERSDRHAADDAGGRPSDGAAVRP